MNPHSDTFYKFVVVDKNKSAEIKEKPSNPTKPTVVTRTVMTTPTTPTSPLSTGKQTIEESKNEEINQNNESIKKEDQEPETKPREKTSMVGNIINNFVRKDSINQSKGSSPSPISPTTSVSDSISSNTTRSTAVDIPSTKNTVTPDSSLVPQAPATTLTVSPLSISPTTPTEEVTIEKTPTTPQKNKKFDFVNKLKMIGSPTTKKPTLPAGSESSISTSVTEDTTNKTNGLSSKSSSTQEENKVNIVEETNLIEKEETSEPVAVREVKLNDENVENVENIENIENVDETEHSDKKLKVKIGNLRDFISRYSNAVFVKLQHEFDELDRRMYSGVDPSEVKAREINDYKNEREELLERPDTETDAQSNGDVRATLADANDALNERGEKLGELNERLDALGGASSEFARMAAEIRRKEANKKWYQVW